MQNGQHSRADARSIGSSALHASATITGSVSAQQAVASREHQRAWGQSQPPPRGGRCMGEPLFWRHCHSRGTWRRPRLMSWLRTELWTTPFSRSRALGPMLPPSALELWPFSCVSARPARGRRPFARCMVPLFSNTVLYVNPAMDFIYVHFGRARLVSAALGSMGGVTRAEPRELVFESRCRPIRTTIHMINRPEPLVFFSHTSICKFILRTGR
eukprot:COSAG02_NODE_18322_length_945_cov_1.968085_1_plen_214_part_00